MANELLEFARNYEYCFFKHKLKVSGRPRAFLLCSLRREDFLFAGKIISEKLLERTETIPALKFMETAQPIVVGRGYVNVEALQRPTAIFLNVGHDRQYKKSLCLQGHERADSVPNGSDSLYNELQQMAGAGNEHEIQLKAVAHQLAVDDLPKFPSSFRASVELVESGKAHSIAISKFFAISLFRRLATPVIWHCNKREGVIIKGIVYATPRLMPYEDFFSKKWNCTMKPIEEGLLP